MVDPSRCSGQGPKNPEACGAQPPDAGCTHDPQPGVCWQCLWGCRTLSWQPSVVVGGMPSGGPPEDGDDAAGPSQWYSWGMMLVCPVSHQLGDGVVAQRGGSEG